MHKKTVIRFLKRPSSLLCFIWLTGLLLGSFLAATLDDTYFSLMRPSNFDRLSIIRQLAAVYLPFLISAYAVSIDRAKLLFLFGFLCSFLISLCGTLIARIYGSAGWLVRFLMLFSAICTIPVFCWFCLRHIGDRSSFVRKDLVICLSIATAIAFMDYFVVSPFLAGLIDF